MLYGFFSNAFAADEDREQPSLEFLEYLGSMVDSDGELLGPQDLDTELIIRDEVIVRDEIIVIDGPVTKQGTEQQEWISRD